MSDEFKAKFEKKGIEISIENRWGTMSCDRPKIFMAGFMSVYPILSELVEALEIYKNQRNWSYWSNRDVGAYKEEWTMWRQNARGPIIAEKSLTKLNDWLECKDEI